MEKTTKEYGAIRLPKELIEELQVWREAYSRSYSKGKITFEFMIRGMLDSLADSEPGVVEELEKMAQEKPELMEKLSKYRGEAYSGNGK